MEIALGVLPLVGNIVKKAYSLYLNNKLKRANRETCKQLAERLREIESTLRDITPKENTVHAIVFKAISKDFATINDIISNIFQEARRSGPVAALLVDPPTIAQELSHSLHLALSCRARIENLQLASHHNQEMQSFLSDWKLLYDRFEQCADRLAVDDSLSAAMKTMNIAATSLISPQRTQTGASSSPTISSDVDESERISVSAFMDLPDKVLNLVHKLARRSLPGHEIQSIVDQIFKFWDVWHLPEDMLAFDVGKRGLPVKLGTGGFGTVYAGKLSTNGTDGDQSQIPVAIKEISLSGDLRVCLGEVLREVFLQMAMPHHCILRMHGVVLPGWCGTVQKMLGATSDESSWEQDALLVTERMTCNLGDALRQSRIQSLEDKIKITTDVANALTFLHSNNVVHRDLKPENVLLKLDSSGIIGHAKLADFGCSRRVYIDQTTKLLSTTGKATGTPLFMPPEALSDIRNCRTTKAWDTWSYGVLLCYVFAYDHMPRLLSMEVHKYAEDGSLSEIMRRWAREIDNKEHRSVAQVCLHVDPRKRPSIENIYDASSITALFEQGKVLYQGFKKGTGVEKDDQRAAQLYQQAADKGHLDAMYNLGVCYKHGTGVQKDERRAAQLYQHAADKGHLDAINSLGVCFKHGTGVQKDVRRAAQLYQQAADKGHLPVMNNLGHRYHNGTGVQKDERRAAQLYQQAADKGHLPAMYNLGRCYEYGTGVQKDEWRAAQLYQQAADKGHLDAINSLGVCYKHGTRVQKDERRAAQLYQQAAEKR